MTDMQVNQVFVDVRKSFRLLYVYQKRVMDLVQFIGDRYSFRYEGGWSWFSKNGPKEGKGSLENWAWDWLNMYFYEFKFKTKDLQSYQLNFSVILQSDTGYYDSEADDQLAIDKFESAEKSETKLILLVGKNCWNFPNKYEFDSNMSLFKKDVTTVVKKSSDSLLLVMSFFLSDFRNHETTLAALKNWEQFCEQNEISDFGVIDKPV